MFEIDDEEDKPKQKATSFYGATSWITASNYASCATYTFLPSLFYVPMYGDLISGNSLVFKNGQWVLI